MNFQFNAWEMLFSIFMRSNCQLESVIVSQSNICKWVGKIPDRFPNGLIRFPNDMNLFPNCFTLNYLMREGLDIEGFVFNAAYDNFCK